jgi:hypothetical protein
MGRHGDTWSVEQLRGPAKRVSPRAVFTGLATLQVFSIVAVGLYVLVTGPATSDWRVSLETYVQPAIPFVWLTLAVAGIVVLRARRGSEGRTALQVGTVFSGLFGVLGGTVVVLVALAVSDYGADFDYPAAPPLPPFGTVVEQANGFDDDDPMRGRESLIDIGGHTQSELVDYYRGQFTEADGWLDGTTHPDLGGGRHVLCIVNHADDRYDEYVEIDKYDYQFAGPSGSPNHYLVSTSRLSVTLDVGRRTSDRCGEAGGWYPRNL